MTIGENIKFDTVGQCEEDPIMNTIDENSFEWHRVSAKDMNVGCLILTLDVMQDSHG